MSVPTSLADWTVAAVQKLLVEGYHESDVFDFKEVLDSRDPNHGEAILKAACSLANTRGGFLIFGVKDSGANRIVGVPRSTENQKHLTDKLLRAEPALDFTVLNPQPSVGADMVLLVAEVHPARSGPHSYVDSRGAREFWRRAEGTAVRMTYPEIRSAFTDYPERAERVYLVFLSLADNWSRLKQMASYDGFAGGIADAALDMSQVRQHLVAVNALCPEVSGDVFRILQFSDSVTTLLGALLPTLNLPTSNRNALILAHNRKMASSMHDSRPLYAAVMTRLQGRFSFESVSTPAGLVPPVEP